MLNSRCCKGIRSIHQHQEWLRSLAYLYSHKTAPLFCIVLGCNKRHTHAVDAVTIHMTFWSRSGPSEEVNSPCLPKDNTLVFCFWFILFCSS